MPWYRVTYLEKRDVKRHTFCSHINAADPATAMRMAPNWYDEPIKAVEDKTYEARLARKKYWSKIWKSAIANMPLSKRKNGDLGLTILGRLLGKTTDNVHLHIRAAEERGYCPKDPKVREKLLKLSGPHGKLITWLAIEKMGLAHTRIKPDQF